MKTREGTAPKQPKRTPAIFPWPPTESHPPAQGPAPASCLISNPQHVHLFCFFFKKYTFLIMFHKNTLVPSDGYCSVKSNSFCSCSIKRGKGITPINVEKCKNSVSQEPVQNEEGESFTERRTPSPWTPPNPLPSQGTLGQPSRPGIQPGLSSSRQRRQLLPAAWGMGQTDVSGNSLAEFKKRCSVPFSSFSKRMWMMAVSK